MYSKYIKRLLDIIIASVICVFASPPFLVVAVLIKMEDRGPVFILVNA